jgi:hypothetical protein
VSGCELWPSHSVGDYAIEGHYHTIVFGRWAYFITFELDVILCSKPAPNRVNAVIESFSRRAEGAEASEFAAVLAFKAVPGVQLRMVGREAQECRYGSFGKDALCGF